MASLYSRVALIICIAITIAHADGEILEAASNNSNVIHPQETLKNLTILTIQQISKVASDFAANGVIEKLINSSSDPNNNRALALSALRSCRELLSLAMDNLNKSLSTPVETVEGRGSVKAQLCATGITLNTCVDGFDDHARGVRDLVFEKLKDPIYLNEEVNKVMAVIDSETDLLGQGSADGYPRWLSDSDRKLLLRGSKISADAVVAKDGSGKYSRISDAINAAPRLSKKRFVIYVKSGMYHENVKVGADKWNVMMIGDGMDKTIVYNNLSYGGGQSTWDSATFAVQGEGFIARDMRFSNTAGAINQQAVALLSTADRSVFYRCHMDGYQDTIYAHSNRQFYRECQIYGTVDFIFGGAAVVIQKSFIFARKPLRGQDNVITAQYKKDPKCDTAIVVQSSTIQASGDLTGVSTFLGRPWTPYATSVFMQNIINRVIDPRGWRPWDDTSRGAPPPPGTIFFAEYGNRGDGASTANRVKWKGVRTNLSSAEAGRFTVRSLIQGDQWLPATQVSYEPGL